jgi:hypothetical protein
MKLATRLCVATFTLGENRNEEALLLDGFERAALAAVLVYDEAVVTAAGAG